MNLGGKIFYNTLAQSLGKVLAAGMGLLVTALLSRHLEESGFGQYSTVVAFLGVFVVFADLGLYMITVREISKSDNNANETLSNALGFRLTASLASLIIGVSVAWLLPYDLLVKQTMIVGIAAFFFVSLNQVLVGVFQKHLVQYLVVISETAGRAINLVLVFLFIKFAMPLPFFILALAAANAITFFFTFRLAKKYETFGIAFDLRVWKKIFFASWPLMFAVLLNLVYFKTDTVILSLFQSEEAVGVYALPYRLLEGFLAFPAMFVGLIMPLISQAAFTNWPRFRQILQNSFNAVVIMAIGLLIPVWFFAHDIIDLLKGNQEYFDSPELLQILILATGIIFFGTLFGYAVVAVNQQKAMIKGYLAGAIIGLGLYLLLIPKFSYWGAAWGTLITELIVAIYAYVLVKRASGSGVSWRIVILTLPAAIMVSAFFYWVSLPWILEIMLGVVIYGIGLIATKAVPLAFLRELSTRE